MDLDDEYAFDDFNDGSERIASAQQADTLQAFARRFCVQLRAVEEALDDGLIGATGFSQSDMLALLRQDPGDFLAGRIEAQQQEQQQNGNASLPLSISVPQEPVAAWDVFRDPLRVDLEVHEQAPVLSLIRTDNVPFDKVLRVFAADLLEIDGLAAAVDSSRTAPQEFGADGADSAALKDVPNLFWSLQLFCETPIGEDVAETFEEGTAQIAFGRLLPVLLQASRFVDRVTVVCKNVVQQLASLFSPRSQLYKASFNGVHLQSVFDRLGDAFSLLMTLDSIFASSDAYAQCLAMYKRMAKNIREDPGRYGVSAANGEDGDASIEEEDRLYALERQLFEIKGKLLDGRIFAGCLEQDWEEGGAIPVFTNAVFRDEFFLALRSQLEFLSAKIGDSSETTHKRKVLGLFGLYVAYIMMFKDPSDKRFLQALHDLQKRVVCVPLLADVVWWPSVFLNQHIPTVVKMVKVKKNETPRAIARALVDQLDAELGTRVKWLYLQTAMWSVRMESTQSVNAAMDTVLKTRSVLLSRGVSLAFSAKNLFLELVALHRELEIPLRNGFARFLCTLVEILKAIQSTFHRRSTIVGESLPYVIQQPSFELRRRLEPIARRIDGSKKVSLSYAALDVLAAVKLAASLLAGTMTRARLAIVKLCLHVIFRNEFLKPEESDDIRRLASRLEAATLLQTHIVQACDCSFLYWSRTLIPAYFQDLFDNPPLARRLPFFALAFDDIVPVLRQARHRELTDEIEKEMQSDCNAVMGSAKDVLSGLQDDASGIATTYLRDVLWAGQPSSANDYEATFISFVAGAFRERLVVPLQRAIETELRFHAHAHLGVSDTHLSPWTDGVKDLTPLLQATSAESRTRLHALSMFGGRLVVDFRQSVTHYLDRTFYNLTAVTLSDWRVYEEMRNLAGDKYGLRLAEVHLPGLQHEQGNIDVLEIMRNIHVFVAKYHYDVHNQMFVEHVAATRETNRQQKTPLHTIGIRHVANSIRTHGTGIMNTTVNYIFQFLTQKMRIFSQFLYDDHIKSPLYKDIRFFRELRDAAQEKQRASRYASGVANINYPVSRAQQFNKDIRKLGVDDLKRSFLDQFRMLITEIGNAMGYIRLVRSGGQTTTAAAIKFVPEIHDIVSFEGLCTQENLSPDAVAAGRQLDLAVKGVSSLFEGDTDFFKLLVEVFAPEFRHEKNSHLRNFYAIIPPLTVNFVEHVLAGKERLRTKKAAGFFCDDGFQVGVAYILKLLQQFGEFRALHWFDSVQQHYAQERTRVQQQSSQPNMSRAQKKEAEQTAVIALKNIQMHEREFELLRFSFDGSARFFEFAEELPGSDSPTDKQKEGDAAGSASESAASGENVETGKAEADNSSPAAVNNDINYDAPAPPPPPPPGGYGDPPSAESSDDEW